jgi:hypothetical protein
VRVNSIKLKNRSVKEIVSESLGSGDIDAKPTVLEVDF